MDQDRVQLGIVIPAYNEEAGVEQILRSVIQTIEELAIRAEVIVVNDGSVDRTAEIVDRLAEELSGFQVFHQENRGIGGALTTGFSHSTAEYLLIWPADLPMEPEDLRPFTEKLGAADVIVGCRIKRLGYNPLMRLNAAIYPVLVRLLFGLRLKDVNWIHLYNGDMMRRTRLTQTGIPMLTEALVRLRDQGATSCQIDVHMKPRQAGVASASRFSVMVKTLRGLLQFWRLWRREQSAQPPRA